MHGGGGGVHVFYYCIDIFHSLPNSLIISRALILMKEVLLPQSVMVGSHTLSIFFSKFPSTLGLPFKKKKSYKTDNNSEKIQIFFRLLILMYLRNYNPLSTALKSP